MKVLLVDDEPTSRRMLNRILVKQFGCEVIEATNGAEALDQLGKHEFTFVLLDLVMPVLNGVETLEAIRESDAAGRNAQQDQVARAAIGFEDLVGDARQGARNIGFLQHDACRQWPLPFSASQDGVKGGDDPILAIRRDASPRPSPRRPSSLGSRDPWSRDTCPSSGPTSSRACCT